jgi:hypothetical protein
MKMGQPNPPSSGDNQNWGQQPQQQPPYQQPYPPQQYQPQQQPPPTPPKPASQINLNMQSINKTIRSVPELVRWLRLIAWTELIAVVVLAVIGACSSLSYFGGLYLSGGFSVVTSFLTTVLQAAVFWGLLMGVALLLERGEK